MASISKECLFVLTIFLMYVICCSVRFLKISSPHDCDKILEIPHNGRTRREIYYSMDYIFRISFVVSLQIMCIIYSTFDPSLGVGVENGPKVRLHLECRGQRRVQWVSVFW